MTKSQFNKISKMKLSSKVSFNAENHLFYMMPVNHMAFRLHSEELEEITKNVSEQNPYMESQIDKNFPDLSLYTKWNFDISEIKAFEKQDKESIKCSRKLHCHKLPLPFEFDFNGKKYAFNYSNFIDAVSVLGKNTEAYICTKGRKQNEKVIYLKSEVGECLLMPMVHN